MTDPDTVQAAFTDAVAPGAVVWDVGAYLGRYTRLAVDAGASVIAIEPAAAAAETLRACFDDAVTVREVALGAEAGRAGLARATADASTTHCVAGDSVRVRTMDGAIADGWPTPDVMKIDTEGTEAAVLAGGAATLREAQPTLFIEVHTDTHGPSPTTDPAALREQLAGYGYAVTVLAAGERMAHWRADAKD